MSHIHPDPGSVLRENLAQWRQLIDELEPLTTPLNAAANALADALLGGGKLIAFGNGGSAADAAHLATELVCRFDHDRPPYPALALTDPGSTLSAIGNDYRFEEVFSRQIEAFARPGDVVLGLSTSGNSENVRQGLLSANHLNATTLAMLGKDGGQCRDLARIELLVAHRNTARVQEAHHLLIHTLCQMIEPLLG